MKCVLHFILFLISSFAAAQIPVSGKIEQFTFNNTLNGLLGNNLSALKPQYGTDRFGNANSALRVVIDSNCVVNDSIANLPMGNSDRSFAFWIKNIGNPASIRSYFNYSFANNSCGITQEAAPKNKVITNYTLSVGSSNAPDTTTWHCLTGVHTASLTNLYIDGVAVNSSTLTFYNNNYRCRIGRSPSGGQGVLYPGFLIDELIIYNRALTPAEVTQICSAGSTAVEEDVATSLPVTIFPNPANNLISIESEVNCSGYEITDLSGKTIRAEKL
ncbi:MAG: LamG domain-containing protein, partial [Bacteroidia bacterium]